MAKARMLSVKAGNDPDLNSMSIEAELVFLLTIAHLDRDGLIGGDPIPLWGKVVPRRVELIDKMPRMIQEWVEHNLVVRYEWKDGAILFFKGFRKHNIHMAYEREPVSDFPPPPGFHRCAQGLIPNDPETAGRLAETLGERSKYHAALVEASAQGQKEVDISLHVNYMQSTCNLHAEVEVEVEREGEGEEEGESNSNGANAPAPPSSFSLKDHVLIKSYYDLHKRYPSTAQMQIIIESSPPVADWVRAIRAWAAKGNNPTNIEGMLDWAFDPSRIDSRPQHKKGKRAQRAADAAAEPKRSYNPDDYQDNEYQNNMPRKRYSVEATP